MTADKRKDKGKGGGFPEFDADPAVMAVLGQSRDKRGWGKDQDQEPEPPAQETAEAQGGQPIEQLAAAILAEIEKQRQESKAKDYHKNTTTLSLRVTDKTAAKVRAASERAGLSVSAWLAEVIEEHLEG